MTRVRAFLAALLCLLVQAQQAPKEPAGLLIVAPEKFHNALGKYVRHKRAQRPTTLVALETILKSTRGVDDPEKLKRFLYERWKQTRIGYVLLVGDADVLPVRYMVLDRVAAPAYDYAFGATDLYYADLAKTDGSFDDWNARKDGFHAGYFGEVRGEKNKSDPINYDEVDYRPDVALGRWPVSTPDEVRIVAEKSMVFELRPRSRRVGFCHVDGWIDTRETLDRLAAALPKGWEARKLYGAKEESVLRLLNDGATIVCHSGHGNDSGWAGCLSTASIDKLRNAKNPAILMSVGCCTARFVALPPYEAYLDVDGKRHQGTNNGEVFTAPPPPPTAYHRDAYNSTGLGEQLLRKGPNGAAAYIGCNTGSQPCAVALLEGFLRAFSESASPRLGDCWSKAIAYYYDAQELAKLVPNDDWYPPSIFFQGMKFMLFGDPSLQWSK